MEYTILIVDDEATQRQVLSGYLKKHGYKIFEASSGAQAIEIASKNFVELILTDFKMPDKSGLDVLKSVRSINPEIAVVIMTAFGTIETAVEAMREGAYDYLTKPINLDELDLLINRIFERQRLVSENKRLREEVVDKYKFSGIIAQSKQMQKILNLAARVADSKASVLVRGETGTGKELIAKTIHYASPRSDKPFIAVNCAALNENLLESELFGHEKGAFTGADKQRRGRFEMADSGTLFLDEVGDIPLSTQIKLLRVLQEQNFERVGGNQPISVDVKIITATNRNLEQLIKDGIFREDLYYRLNVISIEIPPLRERREDILPLIEFFTQKFSNDANKKTISYSKETIDIFLKYNYPGNVRELENIVQRAVVISRGDMITTNDLPIGLKNLPAESTTPLNQDTMDLSNRVESLEKDLVFDALRQTNGNQSKAAILLGISERNLRYRLEKWGMKK